METYVTVSFWLLMLGTTIRMLELAFRDEWPKEETTSLGLHLFSLITGAVLLGWAASLLYL